MRLKLTWKRFFLYVGILLFLLIVRPTSFLLYSYWQDNAATNAQQKGYANDVSFLNKTKVAQVFAVSSNVNEAVAQIRDLVKTAAAQNKRISIAGSRHSMGGHTIYPDGIVLDMRNFNHLSFDSTANILTAGAGALWSDIIPLLNKKGKSVTTMQSNNSFTVGGSISVNCHGWSPNLPSISCSVKSFRLVNANSELLRCSRTENAELFSLVLGGYGLFGVIIDVELHVVDNQLYTVKQFVVNSSDYVAAFKNNVLHNANVGMAYGRINITKEHFMEEAILSVYTIHPNTGLPALEEEGLKALRRTVFRGSANSDYGKKLRWRAEKALTHFIDGKEFTRNQLLNEGVEVFENTDTNYTDILHEYFIPIDSVTQFIGALKTILPQYKTDLLNITLRDVEKDNDTFLPYAKTHVLGFVMLFNQLKDMAAEAEMQKLTQALIDRALALKGTYYLPYRLHATKQQFRAAYPNADIFFSLKKKYDPLELFQNKFYEAYK